MWFLVQISARRLGTLADVFLLFSSVPPGKCHDCEENAHSCLKLMLFFIPDLCYTLRGLVDKISEGFGFIMEFELYFKDR
jgi:hypothetical protein